MIQITNTTIDVEANAGDTIIEAITESINLLEKCSGNTLVSLTFNDWVLQINRHTTLECALNNFWAFQNNK